MLPLVGMAVDWLGCLNAFDGFSDPDGSIVSGGYPICDDSFLMFSVTLRNSLYLHPKGLGLFPNLLQIA